MNRLQSVSLARQHGAAEKPKPSAQSLQHYQANILTKTEDDLPRLMDSKGSTMYQFLQYRP